VAITMPLRHASDTSMAR